MTENTETRQYLLNGYLDIMLLCDGESISYWNNKKFEIDFITSEELVRVCHTINNKNIKRETSGFEDFNHPLKNKLSKSLVIMEKDGVDSELAADYYNWMMDLSRTMSS